MFKKSNVKALDKAIANALERLDPVSSAYSDQITNVGRLVDLREDISPKGVSRDTMAIVMGNLAGIVMILGYERGHVIASKALGFVLKMR